MSQERARSHGERGVIWGTVKDWWFFPPENTGKSVKGKNGGKSDQAFIWGKKNRLQLLRVQSGNHWHWYLGLIRTADSDHILFEFEPNSRAFTLHLITVSPAPVMTFKTLSNTWPLTSQQIPQTLVNPVTCWFSKSDHKFFALLPIARFSSFCIWVGWRDLFCRMQWKWHSWTLRLGCKKPFNLHWGLLNILPRNPELLCRKSNYLEPIMLESS